MLDAGITPVIAHPERQRPFIENPDLLRNLIQIGCISQVTATSIVGGYTEEIQEAAQWMMDENLIHVIASDAHDTVVRPFNIVSALEVLEENYGVDYKDYLVNNAIVLF